MDSQNRDDAEVRRRQESLARRVGEALDQLKPGEAHDCPDAHIIAAYADQALAPDESAKWESHFAACGRCRSVLRVLAASSDTPLAQKEVAHLGELVSTARDPIVMTSRASGSDRRSRAAWRTRWLAPAIGVAAVLVVWFAMRPPWHTRNQSASGTLVAQAPKEELQPSTPPPPVDQASKEPQAADQKTENATPGAATDKLSPSVDGGPSATQQKKELNRPLNGREFQSLAAPPPPPPPASAPQTRAKAAPNLATSEQLQADASSNAAPNAPTQEKQASTAQAQASAAPAEISPALRSAARQRPQALAALTSPQTGFSLLKAPASAVWWRAGKGGVIERSNDAGKTWVSQMSPSQQDWLAGAPFSDTVCWLAGRKGAIARTVDGEHWDLITPPAQAAGAGGVQPDWIGITSLDALSATVTAADGRKFTTADGGMTWQQQ